MHKSAPTSNAFVGQFRDAVRQIANLLVLYRTAGEKRSRGLNAVHRLAVGATILVLVCKCSAPAHAIVGTWDVISIPGNTWVFSMNGRFTINVNGKFYSNGRYNLTKDVLDMRMASGDPVVHTTVNWMNDDAIDLEAPGGSVVLHRKNQ